MNCFLLAIMLYFMSKITNKKNCYLTDPHLFYHLESPVKITQLLQSGMYFLEGNSLVSNQTKQRLKISGYTLAQVPTLVKQKYQKKEREKIILGQQSLENSPLKLTCRKNPAILSSKSKNKAGIMREFSKIKGLKQFNCKIL